MHRSKQPHYQGSSPRDGIDRKGALSTGQFAATGIGNPQSDNSARPSCARSALARSGRQLVAHQATQRPDRTAAG
jgi:hypothetical protein